MQVGDGSLAHCMQKEIGDSYSIMMVERPHAPMQVGDGSEAHCIQRGSGLGMDLVNGCAFML